MSRDVDRLLEDLRDALDVQPLDGFDRRVRAHVRATVPAARRVRSLTSILPPLVAAGLAVGAFLSLPVLDRPFAAAVPRISEALPAAVPAQVPSRAPARPLSAAAKPKAAASVGTDAAAIPASPERALLVLVPRDQIQMLDRLLAARRAGQGVALGPAVPFGLAGDGMVPPVEIPEIHIEPLPGGPSTVERKPR